MDPILTIDIGAGTTDILVFFPDTREHYKAVAISPIKKIAQTIVQEKKDLLITGTIMGGGAVSKAVIEHAKSFKVYMTPNAAMTVNDNLLKVKEKGITIISENEISLLKESAKIKHITFADLSVSGICNLIYELGLERDFSYIAGAVQDHGVCPNGINALDFRHQVMKEMIEKNPSPYYFLFSFEEIPEYLSRMRAVGKLLSNIPHQKVFMMDTGMAALLGASLDSRLNESSHYIIVDIGNSHTLGACLSNGIIGGFFEYHTNNLTPQQMEKLLVDLGNGNLIHREIIAQGGHGAYIRSCPGFHRIDKIVVTGPRRKGLMDSLALEFIEGAPLGDNMMTGTAGLLESINKREKLNLRYTA